MSEITSEAPIATEAVEATQAPVVTAETIKLVEDILNDGTIDIKWRAQLKEQVRKYKANGCRWVDRWVPF